MAYPVVSDTTEELYARLPEAYRSEDAQVAASPGEEYPLLRFISGVVDQLGEITDLIDRVDYVSAGEGGAPGDTSDLVNPDEADATWLVWLAQMVGVILPADISVSDQRHLIREASSGWRAGTKSGMAAAAKTALTGTKYVKIVDHYDGDEWKVQVITKPTETPDSGAVLQAIISKDAKPAGVELVHTEYEASWDMIESTYPTWDDLEAAGSWQTIEETGSP